MESNQIKGPPDFLRDDKTDVIADAQKALHACLSIAASPDYAKKGNNVSSNSITLKKDTIPEY